MFICGGESIYKYFADNNLLDSMIVTEIDDKEILKTTLSFLYLITFHVYHII